MTATIINLTPHTLSIQASDGSLREYPSQGIARVSQREVLVKKIDGIEVFATEMGSVTGVPEPEADTFYVVSRLVATALPGRSDVLVPGQLIRDDQGRVIGARGFAVIN